MTELEYKRQQRKHQTAEEFTPPALVNEMLDKLPKEVWEDSTKTFIDPAAGEGAFLIEILKRKLDLNHPPLQAISTLFAVELMQDNTEEMKSRLLNILKEKTTLTPLGLEEAQRIIDHNLVCSDAFKWDYDNWRPKERKAKKLF